MIILELLQIVTGYIANVWPYYWNVLLALFSMLQCIDSTLGCIVKVFLFLGKLF